VTITTSPPDTPTPYRNKTGHGSYQPDHAKSALNGRGHAGEFQVTRKIRSSDDEMEPRDPYPNASYYRRDQGWSQRSTLCHEEFLKSPLRKQVLLKGELKIRTREHINLMAVERESGRLM